jgi:hypothetical protein
MLDRIANVIPAHAGIHDALADAQFWIPACAGMTGLWQHFADRHDPLPYAP